MKRLLLIDSGHNIPTVIGSCFDKVEPFKQEMKLTEDDTFLFSGGEDVDPSLYGEPRHPTTYSNIGRDLYEEQVFNMAQFHGCASIGICRGSQFLTVMNGGKLIQHVNNHAIGGTHKIKTYDGKELDITSTHHQMHWPYNLVREDFELLAWANESTRFEGYPQDYVPQLESEIIWFPKTRSLGVQGHPEYMGYSHETCEYIRGLIKDFILN